jgi:hypothetical protein
MPLARFEPVITKSDRPQTLALDRSASGVGDFVLVIDPNGGTRRRSWLRHCATNWKVAGSIHDSH